MTELYYPSDCLPLIPAPRATDAQNKFSSSPSKNPEEMFPVVDENGVVLGRATRSYCHSGSKVLHPVVHLHIIDRQGRVYLQKRSASKKIQPLKWDTAVGGHVSFGETILDALYRESFEELHLQLFTPIWIDTYIFESEVDRELVSIYACVGHFDDLVPEPSEIEEGRWWSADQIDRAIGTGLLTPNFEEEFTTIRSRLYSLL